MRKNNSFKSMFFLPFLSIFILTFNANATSLGPSSTSTATFTKGLDKQKHNNSHNAILWFESLQKKYSKKEK